MILVASSDLLSSSTTEPLLAKLLRELFGPVAYAKVRLINRVLRKIGHFLAYAVLSLLSSRAARRAAQERDGELPRWTWRWAACAVGLCLVTAVADELHQSFTEERTGNVLDVLIDMAGATVAQVVLAIRARRRSNPPAANS